MLYNIIDSKTHLFGLVSCNVLQALWNPLRIVSLALLPWKLDPYLDILPEISIHEDTEIENRI